jgi:hypothetical protein
MRWAILIGSVVLGGGLLVHSGLTAAAAGNDIADTEWDSDQPCQMEVVRFHADGTAHIFYDTVYDSVDADEATWTQKGSVLTLKVNDEEYRGRIEGQAMKLVGISTASKQFLQAKSCAFEPSTPSQGG